MPHRPTNLDDLGLRVGPHQNLRRHLLADRVERLAQLLFERHDVQNASFSVAPTGQIPERDGQWRLSGMMTVNTGHDPARANALRVTWVCLAVDRMAAGVPGHCGYSLFAISRNDLVRLRDLHVQYVRAMQDIIAASTQSECVALFCAQLFDLDPSSRNALAMP